MSPGPSPVSLLYPVHSAAALGDLHVVIQAGGFCRAGGCLWVARELLGVLVVGQLVDLSAKSDAGVSVLVDVQRVLVGVQRGGLHCVGVSALLRLRHNGSFALVAIAELLIVVVGVQCLLVGVRRGGLRLVGVSVLLRLRHSGSFVIVEIVAELLVRGIVARGLGPS